MVRSDGLVGRRDRMLRSSNGNVCGGAWEGDKMDGGGAAGPGPESAFAKGRTTGACAGAVIGRRDEVDGAFDLFCPERDRLMGSRAAALASVAPLGDETPG